MAVGTRRERDASRMSRAHDADDAADARPWRWRRCGTFHASEGGIWGTSGTTTARAATRWENAPLEGFGLRFASDAEEETTTAQGATMPASSPLASSPFGMSDLPSAIFSASSGTLPCMPLGSSA